MPVVINDFEVVVQPEQQQSGPSSSERGSGDRPAAPSLAYVSLQDLLRFQSERLLRVRAF